MNFLENFKLEIVTQRGKIHNKYFTYKAPSNEMGKGYRKTLAALKKGQMMNQNNQIQYNIIYEAIRSIPPGQVASFRKIALMIGSGLINVSKINAAIKMHGNPNLLPFHRVVCTNGTLSLSYPFGVEIQKQRLEAEGIQVVNDRVNMKVYSL